MNTTEQLDEAGGIVPIDLTPAQKEAWENTMSLMAWTAPGFRHLFYKLLSNNRGKYMAVPTASVPIAATDAKNIMINPDPFFQFNLKERVFITAHEVMHNVYDDVALLHRCVQADTVPMNDGTVLPFRMEYMQKAMDYRINALLVDSKIGQMPKVGCYDLKIAKANESVLDVYKKLYEQDPDGGHGNGSGGFDMLLPPGKSTGQTPNQAMSQRSPQQWAVELAAAQTLESMRSQGKMPGSLMHMFKSLLEPEVPWTEHIRTIITRRVGSGSYNWRKPDRRFIVQDMYMPGRSGFGAGWLVIWGDTSGSIGERELERYLGELSGIIDDVHPKRMTVIWCDAKIHHVDEVEEAMDLQTIKARGVGGRGGTSVMPVLEWINDNANGELPDMFIAFTDGYVTFPQHEPAYPVLWASVADTKYPWGEVVRVKV